MFTINSAPKKLNFDFELSFTEATQFALFQAFR